MIRVHAREGVPARTRRQLEQFAKWAESAVSVPDVLDVVLQPFPYLGVAEAWDLWDKSEGGDLVIGLFVTPTHREGNPVIFLSARRKDVLDTFAHELMHYRQFRDGLEIAEGAGPTIDVEAEGQALLARYREAAT